MHELTCGAVGVARAAGTGIDIFISAIGCQHSLAVRMLASRVPGRVRVHVTLRNQTGLYKWQLHVHEQSAGQPVQINQGNGEDDAAGDGTLALNKVNAACCIGALVPIGFARAKIDCRCALLTQRLQRLQSGASIAERSRSCAFTPSLSGVPTPVLTSSCQCSYMAT